MNSLKFFAFVLIMIFSHTVQAQSKAKAGENYIVHEKGPYMSYVEVRKDSKGPENIIQIQALNVSGGAGKISGEGKVTRHADLTFPGAAITDISIVQGRYNSIREMMKTAKGMTVRLIDVEYPLRIRVTISQQILDLEIKEAGFWLVNVRISQ